MLRICWVPNAFRGIRDLKGRPSRCPRSIPPLRISRSMAAYVGLDRAGHQLG